MPIHLGSNAKTLHLGLGRYRYVALPAEPKVDPPADVATESIQGSASASDHVEGSTTQVYVKNDL